MLCATCYCPGNYEYISVLYLSYIKRVFLENLRVRCHAELLEHAINISERDHLLIQLNSGWSYNRVYSSRSIVLNNRYTFLPRAFLAWYDDFCAVYANFNREYPFQVSLSLTCDGWGFSVRKILGDGGQYLA